MFQLPTLPASIRVLPSTNTERLRELYPDLPKGPENCITCRGAGSFRWRDPETDEPADWKCSCDDQFLLHRHLLNSGVDKHYQRLFWADGTGVAPEVMDVIDDYIANHEAYVDSGIGLVLWGRYGTGKTMLSSLLLKSLLGKGVDGYFVTFHVMIDMFTAGWDRNELKVWFEHRIRNAGLLVIDDIGREHQGRNAVAETVMDHVLRGRVAADRPTIITSNRTPEELATLYSGNAVSLLSECSIMQQFTGTDYRPEHQGRKIAEAKARLVRPVTLG